MHDNQRQTQWAYIAGVLDSDGCFMINKYSRSTKRRTKHYPTNVDKWSPSYLPAIKISQVDREAIDLVHDELGYGTIRNLGIRKSRPNRQSMWEWNIRSRKQVMDFLEEVLPYLRIKKKRAEFLLSYCKKVIWMGPGSGKCTWYGLGKDELVYREEAYWKMREFNGTKVAATTES